MKRNIYKLMCVALAAAMTTALGACSGSTDDAVADALQEAAAADGEITVAAFPAYADARTRADYEGRHDKTSWDSSDVIYIRLNGEGKWYTLKYDEGSKAWSKPADMPALYREDTYEAVYAPNCELSSDEEYIELKEGAQPCTAEYMTCSGKKPVTISFQRSYSRLRIYCGAGATKQVSVTFPDEYNYYEFLLTPDEYGNAYIYGSWEEDTEIKITTDGMNTTNSSGNVAVGIGSLNDATKISAASVPNRSYFIDNTLVVANLDNFESRINDWTKYSDAGYTKVKAIGHWNNDSNILVFYKGGITDVDLTAVEGMTTIEYGFESNKIIKSVALPEGVEMIYTRCFKECTSLESINIPSSVTDIYDYAFSKCKSLTYIQIPSSVTYFGEGAFMYSGVVTVDSYSSADLDGYIFYECPNIKNIILRSEKRVTIGENDFGRSPSDACLYVPSNLVDAYKSNQLGGISADNVKSIDSDECKEIIKKLENNE
jgi:hypothetical protein